jgi:hypothetical protein
VETNGSRVEAHIDRLGQFEYWLAAFGKRYHVVSVSQGLSYQIEVDGISHRVDRDDGGVVRAPAPAVVVSIAVKPGDTVAVGDRLGVLEAMKMEMQVVAPFAGKVREVLTIPNVQVDTGAPLLQIEPVAEEESAAVGDRVNFRNSPPHQESGEAVDSRCRQNLEELRQLMLGFDVDPAGTPRLVADWNQYCDLPADSNDIRAREDEILSIFVEICALFHRQPEMEAPNGAEPPSSEAYLFSYLRMLDTRGEGLPQSFVDALQRVLAHYGVKSLDRSPDLEESLLWIYKSHQRVEQQIAPILSLLDRRLGRVSALAPPANEEFRNLLDRLVSATRGAYPVVSDLAREVRYRCFDQALFEQACKQTYVSLRPFGRAGPWRQNCCACRMSSAAGQSLFRAIWGCFTRLAPGDAGDGHPPLLPDARSLQPPLAGGEWTMLLLRRIY